jgi:hypothetical protein
VCCRLGSNLPKNFETRVCTFNRHWALQQPSEQLNCQNRASHRSQDGVAMRVRTTTTIANISDQREQLIGWGCILLLIVHRSRSLIGQKTLHLIRGSKSAARQTSKQVLASEAIPNGVAAEYGIGPMRLMRQNCVAVGEDQKQSG